MSARLAILMVCTGNICRSPTAEAVMRSKLEAAGLMGRVWVDSAGTHDYHVGEPPDLRSQAHAQRRGYDLSSLRARKLVPEDFQRFDWLLAMDRQHLRAMQRQCPATCVRKLEMLTGFGPRASGVEVPDPYYGDGTAFEAVLDLIEPAVDELVRFLDQSIRNLDRTD